MAHKASTAFSLGSDLVELRIDHLDDPDAEEVHERLASIMSRSVVAVRPRIEGGRFAGRERDRLALIEALAGESPAFVDIELETARRHPDLVCSVKSKLIVSWHDLGGTPSDRVLNLKAREALGLGDAAKVVPTASCMQDNLRVLRLYESAGRDGLVAFCMGPKGLVSRVGAMSLSPLVYCSLPGEPVAAGQLPITLVKDLMVLARA